jgi:hypothetical protein
MVTMGDGSGTLTQPIFHAGSWPNMATTSLMSVGNTAGSSDPILTPSLATGHNAEILAVSDPHLVYDAEDFRISSPHGR